MLLAGLALAGLALLELVRTGFAGITQAGLFAPIHINAQGLSGEAGDDGVEMESTFDDTFEGEQEDG